MTLKIEIAKDLFRLSELAGDAARIADAAANVSSSGTGESSDNEEEEQQIEPEKIRLNRDLCHVPVERKSRSNCAAHMQRKAVRFYCIICKKYLCLGHCWRMYHSKRNYLFNDPDSTSAVIHTEPTD